MRLRALLSRFISGPVVDDDEVTALRADAYHFGAELRIKANLMEDRLAAREANNGHR